MQNDFSALLQEIASVKRWTRGGYISSISGTYLVAEGLNETARMGDQVMIEDARDVLRRGEIVALDDRGATIMTYGESHGLAVGDVVMLSDEDTIAPGEAWLGRVIDAFGQPLDKRPLLSGPEAVRLRTAPPDPLRRMPLGPRLRTGYAVFNTLLPIARGQRLGVFAGSGVGKTRLLAGLAGGLDADVIVFALIGERGRELRSFLVDALSPEARARSIVIVATSDRSPLEKRRAMWTAMAVAERFRDQGKHVLLLSDSLTRFAEAHREVALSAGEAPSLRAFPPSTGHALSALTERAGPGEGDGAITALFTVLVAGSDMEEPVADMTRGLLDGHIVLSRRIAERGRFPAVDVGQSTSRSLPDVAAPSENALIARARALIAAYERVEPMLSAGLYVEGQDAEADLAVRLHADLDAFVAGRNASSPEEHFSTLSKLLDDGLEGGQKDVGDRP
ncbi:MAG: FliI/YscN family ATPase [Pseudomonadota bacterium]